eukprot:2894468-Amphidinium_carterae.1
MLAILKKDLLAYSRIFPLVLILLCEQRCKITFGMMRFQYKQASLGVSCAAFALYTEGFGDL